MCRCVNIYVYTLSIVYIHKYINIYFGFLCTLNLLISLFINVVYSLCPVHKIYIFLNGVKNFILN